MRYFIQIIATVFLLSLVSGATAGTLSGLKIQDRIIEELEIQNLKGNPAIDISRKFPDCPDVLSVKSIFGSWKTVQISCPKTDWKIAVRTNINKSYDPRERRFDKKEEKLRSFVVLETSLNGGDVIEESHLSLIESKKNIGGGVFHKKDQLVGRILKKPLSTGTIIRVRHLRPNWIIEKNQPVIIEHQVGTIIVNAQGIAQESGQLGQRIWVNNFNSGKKVLCWVKNDKKVTTNAKVY